MFKSGFKLKFPCRCTDSGFPTSLSNQHDIYIQVLNTNDNPPRFLHTSNLTRYAFFHFIVSDSKLPSYNTNTIDKNNKKNFNETENNENLDNDDWKDTEKYMGYVFHVQESNSSNQTVGRVFACDGDEVEDYDGFKSNYIDLSYHNISFLNGKIAFSKKSDANLFYENHLEKEFLASSDETYKNYKLMFLIKNQYTVLGTLFSENNSSLYHQLNLKKHQAKQEPRIMGKHHKNKRNKFSDESPHHHHYHHTPPQFRSVNFFSIHPHSGLIQTTKALDREETPFFCLVITVSDLPPSALTTTTTVIIIVDDINDHHPVFYSANLKPKSSLNASFESNKAPLNLPNYSNQRLFHYHANQHIFSVSENQPPNTHVAFVSAFDADSLPQNNKIHYFISSTTASFDLSVPGVFKINTTTGEISTLRSLDRELHPVYNLTIMAQDAGQPPLTGINNP